VGSSPIVSTIVSTRIHAGFRVVVVLLIRVSCPLQLDGAPARVGLRRLTTLKSSASLADGLAELWAHPQVRHELLELLDLLPERVDHLHTPLGIANLPLAVHARYTRTEILAAFDVGSGMKPVTWQSGVWWDENSGSDRFAFTLDKSAGSFSPTTRYRDYAIGPKLIHWENQSATSLDSDTGCRYISQAENGTNVVLFARLSTADRAFWCLGRRPTSHGDCITACPATSSPSSRPLSRAALRGGSKTAEGVTSPGDRIGNGRPRGAGRRPPASHRANQLLPSRALPGAGTRSKRQFRIKRELAWRRSAP
jgi:hypothetical protein